MIFILGILYYDLKMKTQGIEYGGLYDFILEILY